MRQEVKMNAKILSVHEFVRVYYRKVTDLEASQVQFITKIAFPCNY